MMEAISVVLAPGPAQVRLLARADGKDLMKAVLGPAREAHARAASTLLEALALWQQRPVEAVVCVADRFDGDELDLFEGLGIGKRTVHHQVGVTYSGAPRRHHLAGVGDFRDLRRLLEEEVQW